MPEEKLHSDYALPLQMGYFFENGDFSLLYAIVDGKYYSVQEAFCHCPLDEQNTSVLHAYHATRKGENAGLTLLIDTSVTQESSAPIGKKNTVPRRGIITTPQGDPLCAEIIGTYNGTDYFQEQIDDLFDMGVPPKDLNTYLP